jgi:hypothetical protein
MSWEKTSANYQPYLPPFNSHWILASQIFITLVALWCLHVNFW